MQENKVQRIYKVIMLMIITSIVTAIITSMIVYKKTSIESNLRIIGSDTTSSSGLELTLSKIRAMLDKEYVGELDDKKMLEGAIKGYVQGVGDKYTEYFTKEEMESELDDAYGNYVGIGIYMLIDSTRGKIVVSDTMKDSPAKEAGIKAGDVITKINGEAVTKENASTISYKIKGEENTKVILEIQRDNETLNIDVIRKRIVMSHIETKTLDNNIGYIYITDFDGGVTAEFESEYEKLKEKGIKSLIIDVRSNGGGMVDEATELVDLLLPKDSIILTTINKSEKEVIMKTKKEQKITMPVIVLTNEYTASASEIFAGALKDNGRAKLVGQKTYGKGVIQTLMRLSDGSGLKMTTEEYYTPNKNRINNVGIEPDYKVDLPENIKKLTDENDTQLNKAIELLK